MTDARPWIRLSYGIAVSFAITLGYFLLRLPIQVSDCFANMLALDKPFLRLMQDVSLQPGYLRPGLWAELKVVYDLSGGDYFTWFRWTQAVQAALVLGCFVALVRPRTLTDGLALPLGLAVLVGHHTFAWTIREAFPINTFLTIVLCCAVAASLSFGVRRLWTDVAAVVLFAVAAATVESGLIVAGIFVVGYAVGLRGVSGRAVVAVLLLVAAYFWLRFAVFDVGTPTLLDRDAGFGLSRRNAREIGEMFGGNPWPFYLYNVVSAFVGLLFAEPRDGAWLLTSSVLNGSASVPLVIGLVSSTLATALVARYAWIRRAAWMRLDLDRGDRIVLLALAVAGGNSAISYTYTKDVIMSPAGYFYAAAVMVAVRDYAEHLSARLSGGAPRAAFAGATVLLLVLSGTWSIRAAGLHAGLTQTAYSIREQWAYADETIERMGYDPMPPKVEALKTRLQGDAVTVRTWRPQMLEGWTVLFEMD